MVRKGNVYHHLPPVIATLACMLATNIPKKETKRAKENLSTWYRIVRCFRLRMIHMNKMQKMIPMIGSNHS